MLTYALNPDQIDNLNPANAGLQPNVPAFIPGQPYGYGYGEESANDADNEAEKDDNHRKDRSQSLSQWQTKWY